MVSPSAIDLVILDLDGTVIDLFRAGVPSPRVSTALAAVQAAGIPLTIGTGRTLDYIQQNLAALNLRYPVVTAHGCVVGDPQSGEIYHETFIDPAVGERLLAWLDATPLVTVLYASVAGRVEIYQNRPSQDAAVAFHDHVFGTPRTLQPELAALYAWPTPPAPIKFICDNDPTVTQDFFPTIVDAFGAELYLTRSHPRLFEGMALGVDKGTGLHALCQLLQIDPARVLAIGDNDNDIPMLKAAGYAVAMGNATPGVKAIADWVAPPIDEDGAAVVLEQLLRSDSPSR